MSKGREGHRRKLSPLGEKLLKSATEAVDPKWLVDDDGNVHSGCIFWVPVKKEPIQ